MKLFFLLPLALLLSCQSAQKVQAQAPVARPLFITWDKKMIDLGKVRKGEQRSMVYEFTNTSGQPVQIDIVDACDCTKVDFPRGVIAHGAKGKLDVVFNSAEKDASETIDVRIIFLQTDAAGNPRIETIQYKYNLEK